MKRMLLSATLAALFLAGPLRGQEDPDRQRSSTILYSLGLRLETEKPVDLAAALLKYKNAVERAAQEEKDAKDDAARKAARANAAAALVRTGYCNEKLEPENVAEAQASYARVVADFSDVENWGAIAKEKVAQKGVDVHLDRLFKVLRAWRDTPDRSPLALAEIKKITWDKIQPLDKEAIHGLLAGLGHADEVIRDFSGDSLAEVTDAEGVAGVITRLNDASTDMRAGAATALQKIFNKFNQAAQLDRQADELLRDLDMPIKGKENYEQRDKLRDEAKKFAQTLKGQASKIRHNIPDALNTPEIQSSLEKIIGDESAVPEARLEAAQAAGWIGSISGPLVDALIRAAESKNRNVRQGACRASGEVDLAVSADKQKIVARLIKVVQYEPAKDPDHAAADWANDEMVRQAAAEALERTAVVKSLPALIEALDDNDARVRHAAFRALHEITRKDFDYGKDERGALLTYEADKPLPERKKAQAKWEEWWKNTDGLVILVETFWRFQSQWKDFPVQKLANPALFLKEVESRSWVSHDAKADMERARRVVEIFQRTKDVFVQDAVDEGPGAFDRLLKFIGGETDLEPGKANVPTRCFVAEACAKIVERHNLPDKVSQLRDTLIQGDSPAKKAGAAMAIGFLPKDKVGPSEREALQVRGLVAEPEVRQASAEALGRVGDDLSAADLAKAAQDENVSVQVAALRALAELHPANEDVVGIIGELVAHEPDPGTGGASKKSKDSLVREHGTDALGAIGLPSAIPHLIRARRDNMVNVREAARIAVRKVHKADPAKCVEEIVKIMVDTKRKSEDRIGAALSLGDTGDVAAGKPIVLRLVDKDPPLHLRDEDAGVRIALCDALGDLKAKTLTVVEKLIQSVADEAERESVRDAAYNALKSTTGVDPDVKDSPDADKKFKASDPKPAREAAIQAWRNWLKAEKANLKDEA